MTQYPSEKDLEIHAICTELSNHALWFFLLSFLCCWSSLEGINFCKITGSWKICQLRFGCVLPLLGSGIMTILHSEHKCILLILSVPAHSLHTFKSNAYLQMHSPASVSWGLQCPLVTAVGKYAPCSPTIRFLPKVFNWPFLWTFCQCGAASLWLCP